MFTLKKRNTENYRRISPSKNFLRVKNEIFSSPLFAVFKKCRRVQYCTLTREQLVIFTGWFNLQPIFRIVISILGPDNDNDPNGSMRFFDKAPSAEWKRISDLRAGSGNAKEFDENLYHSITLGTEDLDKPDIWVEFEKCFSRIDGLQSYEKVYSAWNTHELSVIANENVQLLELRSFLGGPVVLINREKVLILL